MKLVKLHKGEILEFYTANVDSEVYIPMVGSRISAGFPSPADDFLDLNIDLNQELIKNPSSTFYARVKGESMKDIGINDGDLLIIDKSLEPRNNMIAICFLDGEFTVKRIQKNGNEILLIAENEKYKPIKVTEENDFIVWGIVIHCIKSF